MAFLHQIEPVENSKKKKPLAEIILVKKKLLNFNHIKDFSLHKIKGTAHYKLFYKI